MGMDRVDRGTIEIFIWRLDHLIDEFDDLDKETIKERILELLYRNEDDSWGLSVLMTKCGTYQINEERRKKYFG